MKNKRRRVNYVMGLLALVCLIVTGIELPEMILASHAEDPFSEKHKWISQNFHISFKPQTAHVFQTIDSQDEGSPHHKQAVKEAFALMKTLIENEVLPDVAVIDLQSTNVSYSIDALTREVNAYDVLLESGDGGLSVRLLSEQGTIVDIGFSCALAREPKNIVSPVIAISNLIKFEGYEGVVFATSDNAAVYRDTESGFVVYAENKILSNVYQLSLSFYRR
ncbi:MAG: hypothetical protein VB115_06380 [Christensenellaceae bacterium]|nr:hypothetical protein [Christensenellaceae bacterium]